MADLRIVDAPLLSTVKGTEKLPTGGEGNFSVSIDQVADFSKLKWTLATEGYVDNAVGNVQEDLNLHKDNFNNPHQVTKDQVGLGNVDNTADVDKPIGSATQAALTTLSQNKAEKTYVDTQLNSKADKATTYSKTESDSLLSNKSDTTYVNTKYSSHIKTFLNTGAALANTANGEYFFIISSDAEKVEDLYLNVNGVATNQNKSELSSLLQHNSILGRDVAGAHLATSIGTASGANQQAINDFGGAKWYSKLGGYDLGATVTLSNGNKVKSTEPNNIVDPNVDMTGWVNTQDASFVVDGDRNQKQINDAQALINDLNLYEISSISNLRSTLPIKEGQKVYLISVNEGQGEGGGVFVATQKSGSVDNGGTIISSQDPLLFWVRVNYEEVAPEMFGAVGDGISDDAIPLQKSFLAGADVRLKAKTYTTSLPLYHGSSFKLRGSGYYTKSRIIKTTNTLAELPSVMSPTGAGLVSYNKDATLIAYPIANDYVHDVVIEDVQIGKTYSETGQGISYFAPYLAQSSLKRTYFIGTKYSMYTVNQWMCTFERCEGACPDGWVVGGMAGDIDRGGTTSVYIACWSKNVFGVGANAWSFYGMGSTVMISCGTDGIGKDGEGNRANSVLRFENSDISLKKFSTEVAYTRHYIESLNSKVSIEGLGAYLFNNISSYAEFIFKVFDSSFTLIDTNISFANTSDSISDLPPFIYAHGTSRVRIQNSTFAPKIKGFNGDWIWKIVLLDSSVMEDSSFDGNNIQAINVYPNDTTAFPVKGNFYYNSTTNKLMFYTGTAWVAFSKDA